jgi:integrase/recombinase XerD
LISFASVKKNETDLIFPELKVLKNLDNTYLVQKEISNADSKLNKALKKIANMIELGKTLTMHISRHTFGNLSGDLISIQMLQKLYRHTSITTTIGYQANFIHKDADDALESVLNY